MQVTTQALAGRHVFWRTMLILVLGMIGLLAGWILLRIIVQPQYTPTAFQASRWNSGNFNDRYGMARTLVDQKMLLGCTKNQVVTILGAPCFTRKNSGETTDYFRIRAPGSLWGHQVLRVY